MAMPSEPEREIDYEAILRKPFWTVQDIVDLYSLASKNVVYRWNQDGWGGSPIAPKPYPLGKHIIYKRDAVMAWFESRGEKPLCGSST